MLRVFETNLGPREADAVWQQVMSGRVGPGERVAEFEAMLCAETGAKHAICCNSGTTALMLAIRTLAVADGVVAFPSYTFLAGANAANMCDKTVRLFPILPRSLLCSGPRLDNIESVTLFIDVFHNGQTVARPQFCHPEERLNIVKDAAQAVGLFRLSGDDTATLSFSCPKIVTTSQGGAVLTNVDAVADSCRRFCDHGGGNWRKTRIHEAVGGNFRMSDLSAALGVVQMQRLPELLGIRRERFGWYREFFPQMPEDGWCALVRSTKAKECIAALAEAGYEALQPYRPVQESLPFRNNPIDPEAVKAADELLYLPVHYKASRKDINTICLTILKVDPCALGN